MRGMGVSGIALSTAIAYALAAAAAYAYLLREIRMRRAAARGGGQSA
jgi:Na+-driven multidrug efflux pump